MDCKPTQVHLFVPSSAKNHKTVDYITCSDNDECDNDLGTGLRFLFGFDTFKSISLATTWEHPQNKTKMVSIAIVIPSRVGKGQWILTLGNSRQILVLTVQWPSAMLNIIVLLTDNFALA